MLTPHRPALRALRSAARAAVLALALALAPRAGAQHAAPADTVPAAARAHHMRGRAADSAGRAAVAQREYEAAVAIAPRYVDASIALATVLIGAGDAAEAREVIARAVKWSPADPRLLNLRIRRRAAAAADRSASGAVPEDRKRRAANPGDEAIALSLAQVLETRGDAAGAAALYDTLASGPAPSERVYLAAARQAAGAGAVARAAALARTGLGRHPRSPALRALADSLAGAGRP